MILYIVFVQNSMLSIYYTLDSIRPFVDEFDDDDDDVCPWLWHGNYRNIVLTLMDSTSLGTLFFMLCVHNTRARVCVCVPSGRHLYVPSHRLLTLFRQYRPDDFPRKRFLFFKRLLIWHFSNNYYNYCLSACIQHDVRLTFVYASRNIILCWQFVCKQKLKCCV